MGLLFGDYYDGRADYVTPNRVQPIDAMTTEGAILLGRLRKLNMASVARATLKPTIIKVGKRGGGRWRAVEATVRVQQQPVRKMKHARANVKVRCVALQVNRSSTTCALAEKVTVRDEKNIPFPQRAVEQTTNKFPGTDGVGLWTGIPGILLESQHGVAGEVPEGVRSRVPALYNVVVVADRSLGHPFVPTVICIDHRDVLIPASASGVIVPGDPEKAVQRAGQPGLGQLVPHARNASQEAEVVPDQMGNLVLAIHQVACAMAHPKPVAF